MFLFELLNLGLGFKKYFDVSAAVTAPLEDEAYTIRHRVYCEELGFEPVRADRKERDEYDVRSTHVLIRSLKFGRFVGCARLVRADPVDPEVKLPVERACASTIDPHMVSPARLPRGTIGEISRLAIMPEFRRRNGEKHTAFAVSEGDFGTVDMPRFPYIQVGLYLGVVALARHSGVRTLLVLTEPRLAGHFSKLGVRLRSIGGPVEHRGTRIPSMMQIDELEAHLPRVVRPMYDMICGEIEVGLKMRGRAATPSGIAQTGA